MSSSSLENGGKQQNAILHQDRVGAGDRSIMFEKAVRDLLQRYLRDYLCVDEVGLQSIVVSLWSGKLELDDLQLQPDVLRKTLGLPMAARRGSIRKLVISIPWSALQSQPVVVRLEGIEIVAQDEEEDQEGKTQQQQDEDRDEAERSLRAKIERLEALEAMESAGKGEEVTDDASEKKKKSFWEKLATKILDNLQLVLMDVHVRIEQANRTSEMRADELALVSADAAWREAFVSEQGAALRKLARISNLKLYLGEGGTTARLPRLFCQPSLEARLTVNREGGRVALVDGSIKLGSLEMGLCQAQVRALQGAADDARRLALPPTARERWRAAIDSVLEQCRERRREQCRKAWVVARRGKYVSLFKRRLAATREWSPDLSPAESKDLSAIEQHPNMYFADIVRLRKVAYEEVRIQLGDPSKDVQARRRDRDGDKGNNKPARGWLSSWWYGDSSEGGAQEDATPLATDGGVQVSEEDREKLFETIGYDPEDEEAATPIDRRTLRIQLEARIDSATVAAGEAGARVAELQLGAIDFSCKLQGALESASLVATSIAVRDPRQSGPFASVVASADASSTAALVNVSVQRPKSDGPLAVDLRLEQALRIVYNAHFIEGLNAVFAAEDADAALRAAPAAARGAKAAPEGSTLDAYRAAYAETSIEDIWSADSAPSVNFVFKAPTLVLPQDFTDPTTPCLVLDLGQFRIGQRQGDSGHYFLKAEAFNLALSEGSGAREAILSDVSLDVSVGLCEDMQDLTKPRVSVVVDAPAIELELSTTALRRCAAVIGGDLTSGSASTSSVTDDPDAAALPLNGADEDDASEPGAEQAGQATPLAERLSLRARARLQALSLTLVDEYTRVKVDVRGVGAEYSARTFDSRLVFATDSMVLLDLMSDTALFRNEGDDHLASLTICTARRGLSPRFAGFDTDITLACGQIAIKVPQRFVENARRSLASMPTAAAAAERPGGAVTPAAAPSKTAATNSRYALDAAGLSVHLIGMDQDHVVATAMCGRTEVQSSAESLSAHIAGFDLAQGDRKLITVEEGAEQAVALTWSPAAGTVLEMDPFRAVLDQNVLESLQPFIRGPESQGGDEPSGTPQARAADQPAPAASGGGAQEGGAGGGGGGDFELRLRNPGQPFVLELISTEAGSFEIELQGLAVSHGRVVAKRTTVLLGGQARVALCDELVYEDNHLHVQEASLVVNLATRELAAQVAPQVQAMLARVLSRPAPEPAADSPPLRATVDVARLVLRDECDERGVSLALTDITYEGDTLAVDALRLVEEEDEALHLLAIVASASQPALRVQTGAPTRVTLGQDAEFRLNPTSKQAAMALLGLLGTATAFYSKAAAGNSQAAEKAPQPTGEPGTETLIVDTGRVSLKMDTFRPKLSDVAMEWQATRITQAAGGAMRIALEALTMPEIELPASVEITVESGPDLLQIGATLAAQDENRAPCLRLGPRSIYQLSSALKHNLLARASECPVYQPPSSGGSTELTFELSARQLDAELQCHEVDEDSQAVEEELVAPQPPSFSTITLKAPRLVYAGGKLSLSTPSASMVAEGRPKLALDAFELAMASGEDEDGDQHSDYTVKCDAARFFYDALHLQRLFNMTAALESLRVQNLLERERKEEGVYVAGLRQTITASIATLSFAADAPGAQGSEQRRAVLAKMSVSLLSDVVYRETEVDRVMQLSLGKASLAFAYTGADLRPSREFPLLEDTAATVKVVTASTRAGVLRNTRITVMVEHVSGSVQLPLVPEVAALGTELMRRRPSQRVVRQAIMQQASDDGGDSEGSAPQAQYSVSVTVDSLGLACYGSRRPLVRLLVCNTSMVEGSSEGSASSMDDTAFKGDLDLRRLSFECFNPVNLAWEPILEPCDMACKLETVPHPSGHRGVKLDFHSSSSIRFNVVPRHLDAVMAGAQQLQDMLAELETNEAPSNAENVRGGASVVSVSNWSDIPLQVAGVVVGPAEQRTVRASDLRLMVKAPGFSSEILMIDKQVQVIEAPTLAAYVSESEEDAAAGAAFAVSFASTTSLRNNTDKAIQIRCAAPKATPDASSEMYVPPGGAFHVPSRLGGGSVLEFRLDEEQQDSAWRRMEVSEPKPSDDMTRVMSTAGHSLTVRVHRTCFPMLAIELLPLRTITNSLPETLVVQVVRRDGGGLLLEAEHAIEPAGQRGLYTQDAENAQLRFSVARDEPGRAVPLAHQQGTFGYELRLPSRAGRPRTLAARFEATELGMDWSARFWVQDSTSLGLHLDLPQAGESGPAVPGTPADEAAGKEVEMDTWENQRKYPLRGWKDEMLPGQRPAWSDKEGMVDEPRTRESIALPGPGWKWTTDWFVDTTVPNTNEEGWQHCAAFLTADWDAECGWTDMLRRRRWVRRCRFEGKGPVQVRSDGKTMTAVGQAEARFALPRGSWSPVMALDLAPGTSNVFPVSRPGAQTSFFEVVLSVESHPTLADTRLCTLVPRLVLISRLSGALECVQAGSDQTPVLVDGSVPFWWQSKPREVHLCARLDGSEWSQPFSVATLGESCIRVGGKRIRVETRRGGCAATMLVVFDEDDVEEPMYKVHNISMDTVIVRQRGCGGGGGAVTVGPYSADGFAWTRPTAEHIIELGFEGHESVTVPVDFGSIGAERRVRLPARSAPAAADGGTLSGEEGPALLFLRGTGFKLVASSPKAQGASVLVNAARALASVPWNAEARKSESTAVSIVRIGAGETPALAYGDVVALLCTSSDGKPRALAAEASDDVLSAASGQKTYSLVWRQCPDEAHSDVGLLDEACRFRLLGANQADASLDIDAEDDSGAFGLEAALNGALRVVFDERSRKLLLKPDAAAPAMFSARRLSSFRTLPQRIAFVNVDIVGKSHVVRISETSLAACEAGESMSSVGDLVAADEGAAGMMRFDLSFTFADFGASLLSDLHGARLREALFLCASLAFRVTDTAASLTYEVRVDSLRVDNMLADPPFPNMLRRTFDKNEASSQRRGGGGGAAHTPPMFKLKLLEKHTQLNVMYVQHMQMDVAPLDVQLDEGSMNYLGQLATRLAGGVGSGERPRAQRDLGFHAPGRSFDALCAGSLARGSGQKRQYYFRALQLSAIRARVSFLKNTLTEIERAPIELEALSMKHVTADAGALLEEIKRFYVGQVQQVVFKLIGYALPGNPGELFSSLGGEAVVQSIFKGAVRGFATLGSLGSTLANVDADYKRQRTARPQTLGEGFKKGGAHISDGFVNGVTGLIRKPAEGADKDGIAGAIAGFGSGLVGLFTKPVSGVASAVGAASQGIVAETKTRAELEAEKDGTLRARPLRLLAGRGSRQVVTPYDLQRGCVLAKLLLALEAAASLEQTPPQQQRLAALSPAQEDAVARAFVDGLVLDGLPCAVVHSTSHVALGTFTTAGAPPLPPRPTEPIGGALRRLFELEDKRTSVKLLWWAPSTADSAQALRLAMAETAARLGKTSVGQCERALRERADLLQKPELGRALADAAKRFGAGFRASTPPARCLAVLEQAFAAVEAAEVPPEEGLAKLLLAAETWRELPVLTLCTTRAYRIKAVTAATADSQAQRALEALEAALLGILKGDWIN